MVAITSNVTSGAAATFNASDNDLTLSQADHLISTGSDALLLANGTYNLTVDGIINGADTSRRAGIFVQNGASAAINVGDTGVVRGGTGMSFSGGATVVNNGSIIGTLANAIEALAALDYEITNRGSITSVDGDGIFFQNSGNHSVVNSGVITSAFAITSSSTGIETITNVGTINGNISLGDGADSVSVSGAGTINGETDLGAGNDSYTGGVFRDTVHGGNDDDFVAGNEGADVLAGGAGIDTLNGGAGDDQMTGDGGNDLYVVDRQGDTIIETAGDNGDVVQTFVSYVLAADANIETLQTVGALGKTALNLTGNGIGQAITGNDGNNVLKGLGGSDTLIGRAGADTLMGGEGNDVLTGGKNKDAFVFNIALIANQFDIITDFNHADDGFRLENSFFKGLSSGKLDKDEFQIIASPNSNKNVDGDDFILYDKDNGDLYFDRDGSATQFSRVRFASVSDNSNVDHTDFFVI